MTEPLRANSFVSACGGGRQLATESVDNRKRRVSMTLRLRSVDAGCKRLMSELCGVK